MSDKIELARPFVNEVLHFFRNQISELKEQPDLVESLEVAVQCLEAVYRLPADDLDGQGTRVANIGVYFLNISRDSHATTTLLGQSCGSCNCLPIPRN